jgi:hypothetical protein
MISPKLLTKLVTFPPTENTRYLVGNQVRHLVNELAVRRLVPKESIEEPHR